MTKVSHFFFSNLNGGHFESFRRMLLVSELDLDIFNCSLYRVELSLHKNRP